MDPGSTPDTMLTHTYRRSRGFTLIELMIVVAILGIMATMAIPTFLDRVVRAQVSEGVELSSFVRQSVQESWRRNGRMPPNNGAAGLPPADMIVGNYVSSVEVEDGAVTITYGQRSNRFLSGKRLTLRPAVVDVHPAVPIAWVCGRASTPERMQARGTDHTDLQPAFLPIDCRSQ